MSITDGNSEKFINIYNELDNYMRKQLNSDEWTTHTDLIKKITEKNKIFKRYKHELKSFANLRNAIIHNPDTLSAKTIAEPHDNIVKKYREIKNYVMNPPNALDTIAINTNNIYTTQMDAMALNVMREMNKNTYTHVPVVENGHLVGVFSENTIFSYIVKNEDVIIESEMLIKEFADFIPLNNHESEYFVFVPKNTLVTEIEEMFQNGLKDKKRISVIFITQNGKENEKLLGLITAWDLAGYLGN